VLIPHVAMLSTGWSSRLLAALLGRHGLEVADGRRRSSARPKGQLRALPDILPVIVDSCHLPIFEPGLDDGNQLDTHSVEFKNRLDDFGEGAIQTVERGRVDCPPTRRGDGW
jgi:hypothetical protein